MKWLSSSGNMKKISFPPLSWLWRNWSRNSTRIEPTPHLHNPSSQLLTVSVLLLKREAIEGTNHRISCAGTHRKNQIKTGSPVQDHKEDMRRWDGKYTLTLEAQVRELQAKPITHVSSYRKVAAAVPSEQFPRVEGLILLLILRKGILIHFYKK